MDTRRKKSRSLKRCKFYQQVLSGRKTRRVFFRRNFCKINLNQPTNQDWIEVNPVQQREAEEEDDIEAEAEENDSSDEEPFLGFPASRVRGAGRPSILRTGQPGRPRKRFNMVQGELAEYAQDYANVAEISVKEALSGCHADQWQRAISRH